MVKLIIKNTGYRNPGDWNSGDCNSGYWNSGDYNSGYFNVDSPKIRIFGKETDVERKDIVFPNYFYFRLTEWISSDVMSDEEKKLHPEYKTTEGYLKVLDYKDAWKKSFKKATVEDVELTLKLPNFDYEIFEEITGISKEMIQDKIKKRS